MKFITEKFITESEERTMSEHENSSKLSGLGAGIAQKALDPVIQAIREEAASARHEISDRVSGAKSGAVLVAAAAIIGVVSVGLVAALAVALLSLSLELWAATAITLGIFVVVTVVLLAVGLRGIKRGMPPVPADTIDEVRSEVRDRLPGGASRH